MARYAIVQGGVVVNVVLCDTAPANGVRSDTASPGDTWDGSSFHRTPLPAPTQAQLLAQVTAQCAALIAAYDVQGAIAAGPKSPQAQYLAALRALPASTANISNPVFPVPPTAAQISAWNEYKASIERRAAKLTAQDKAEEAVALLYQTIGTTS